MDTLGLYLHIPFCLSKCLYCDFCSRGGTDPALRRRYVDALLREMENAAPHYAGRPLDTVFFGGGTPSLLDGRDFLRLGDGIRRLFSVTLDAEWTAETNPATADRAKFAAMKEAGINRLSIGMQSANDRELAALGRAHRHADLLRALDDAHAVGFSNINLDLMFGIPLQTSASFSATLREAIRLLPTHLSVYSLQIEEGTPFYEQQSTLPLPSEDEESEMRALLAAATRAAGFARYEISNYAKAGYESRHNLRYWKMKDYLGLGIAAHSLIGSRRFFNREDLSAYLADPCGVREDEEHLSDADREYETVMLGLRLGEGIREEDFRAAFGRGFYETYGERLMPFSRAGLVITDAGGTHLSDEGMALSNSILAAIL